MLRRTLLPALLATPALLSARAQDRPLPPHGFLFGSWTGGIFPAIETQGSVCFGAVTMIVTADVVMRASSLDVAFRQRLVETVALAPNGVEIRLAPIPGRAPPEAGFGCDGNPDLLRVVRRGEDEVVLQGCNEFPFPLRRCKG
ncbi:hypothetical protein [Sabulicella rubraurantiaca]|uniref:hypothetical protein n=1 Tax=Sabulicella rubraurantiaca TaxID=2811429 RepID=UPI001A956541|nr:hypothetical protein [Sabulicella rubraurantiaca]